MGNHQGRGLDSLWRKGIRPRPLYSFTMAEKIWILIGIKTDGATYDLIQTAKKSSRSSFARNAAPNIEFHRRAAGSEFFVMWEQATAFNARLLRTR